MWHMCCCCCCCGHEYGRAWIDRDKDYDEQIELVPRQLAWLFFSWFWNKLHFNQQLRLPALGRVLDPPFEPLHPIFGPRSNLSRHIKFISMVAALFRWCNLYIRVHIYTYIVVICYRRSQLIISIQTLILPSPIPYPVKTYPQTLVCQNLNKWSLST